MSTTPLFTDVTAEVTAIDRIQHLLGGRIVEQTQQSWREVNDGAGDGADHDDHVDRLEFELLAHGLADDE